MPMEQIQICTRKNIAFRDFFENEIGYVGRWKKKITSNHVPNCVLSSV